MQFGKLKGCYKIILDCKESNVGFYQKSGFEPKERQCAWYNEEKVEENKLLNESRKAE